MQTLAKYYIILAAVSCTQVHNVTGNKYKFVQIVQEAAADDRVLTVAIDKISTCYSTRHSHIITIAVISIITCTLRNIRVQSTHEMVMS